MVCNPQLPILRRILSLLSANLRGMKSEKQESDIDIWPPEIQKMIDEGSLLPPQTWNLPSLSIDGEKLNDEEIQAALDEIREDLI